MDGRLFLDKHLCWQIGNSRTRSVKVWKDRWIPPLKSHSLPICEDPELNKDSVVDCFIEDRQWNLSQIAGFIREEFVQAIKQIPLSSREREGEDKVIWVPARNGICNVKAGYNRAHSKEVEKTDTASSSVAITTDWKNLWSISMVPRIKNLAWRHLANAVAINEELIKRRRWNTDLCPVCEMR